MTETQQTTGSGHRIAVSFYGLIVLFMGCAFWATVNPQSGHWQLLDKVTVDQHSGQHAIVLRNQRIHKLVSYDLSESEELEHWQRRIDKTQQQDLVDGHVIAGLSDSWLNLRELGQRLYQAQALSLADAVDYEDMLNRVESHLLTLKEPWLIAHGYNVSKWDGADSVELSRKKLDVYSYGKPVILLSHDRKQALLNSLAFKELGLSAETELSGDSRLGFDAYGQPSGLIFGDVIEQVLKHAHGKIGVTVEEKLALALNHLRKLGRTAAFVTRCTKADFLALQKLQSLHELPLNLYLFVDSQENAWIESVLASGPVHNERLHVIGLQISHIHAIVRGFEGFKKQPRIRALQASDKDIIERALQSGLKVYVGCQNIFELQYASALLTKLLKNHSQEMNCHACIGFNGPVSRQLLSLLAKSNIGLLSQRALKVVPYSLAYGQTMDLEQCVKLSGVLTKDLRSAEQIQSYFQYRRGFVGKLFGPHYDNVLKVGHKADLAVLESKPVPLKHSWQKSVTAFRTYIDGIETQPIQ